MKAVAYCRVSSEEQVVEGFSLDTQQREIKDYCRENNIELLQVYIDAGVSAFHNALKDRPQGKFILEHIYNKDIDCVIAISDDRMFRNTEDSIVVNNFADKNGVKLIYTRQIHYLNMDPYSSFITKNFSAMMNEAHSLQYSLKVKQGLMNKIKKGEWNGKSPYGYDLVNKHLQVNDIESNVVKLIFSMYLDKKGGELICNYLNDNNYTPPKGKYWNKNSVLGMLRNDAYTGKTVFNRRAPKGSGKKYNDKSEWIIVENTHTPIISQEDFDTVQNMMIQRKKQNGMNNTSRNLSSLAPLAGLVFCEHCHSLYIPTTGSSKARGKIHYYGCGARRRNGKSVCSTHLIPAELLEKFVLYRMREILTSDMYKEQFEQQLSRELEILQSKKKDIAKLKRDIAKISTQKEKLLNLMLSEDNEELVKVYKEKLEDIIAQLSINNDQLKLYESIDISKEEREIRKQFNLSHQDITYRDFQELSREQLKVFFNYMIDHITIREMSFPDDPKTMLAITIYLKLNGYAPKGTLEYLKDLKTEDTDSKKTSHSKNDLLNGGGEGEIRTLAPVSQPTPLAGEPLRPTWVLLRMC